MGIRLMSCFLALLLFFTSCTQYNSHEGELNENFTGKDFFKGIFFAQGAVADKIPLLDNQIKAFQFASEQDQKKQIRLQDKIISYIDEAHPEFFQKFNIEITSGDQNRIQNVLKSSSKVILESAYKVDEVKDVISQLFPIEFKKIMDHPEKYLLNDNGEISMEKVHQIVPEEYHELIDHTIASEYKGNQKSPNVALAIVCVVYFAVGVHNVLAITVAVFAAGVLFGGLAVKFTVGQESQSSGSDNLYGEILVNQISKFD